MVCDGLEEAKRLRYVFNYVVEALPPTDPIDESQVGDPPFALQPTFPGFKLDVKHDGSFVRPDRLDIEISTPAPGPSSVRTIRIGERQWFDLGAGWQEEQDPTPFPFLPPRMCETALADVTLAAVTGKPESVGERAAQHYRLEGVPTDTASGIFGAGSDMGRLLKTYDIDVWLSDPEGQLVKLESVSTASYPSGRELTMKISLEVGPYNEGGISIEPPI